MKRATGDSAVVASTPNAPGSAVARRGWYRRLFAWILSKAQNHYGDAVDTRKRELLGDLSGTVVEIGAGAGANCRFYDGAVTLIAVEPNAWARPYLTRQANEWGIACEIRDGAAERMAVAAGSADAVVSTLVLCSVDDPEAAIAEIRRVLKPGGRFVFVEHVAAPPGSGLRRWQRRLRGFWRRIGDGCTLDRDTAELIRSAGFRSCRIEEFDADSLRLVRPHIAGEAIEPG